MAEIADIISKLLERTNEGKVSWKTSVDEKTFTAVVGNTSTLVSARDDAIGNQQVQFRILDSQGREIERYDTLHQYDAEIGASLREVYTKAKRVALGVAAFVESLGSIWETSVRIRPCLLTLSIQEIPVAGVERCMTC